jgi:N-methylhydantoinase B
MKTDLVTFEVLRNAFVSIAEEMGASLIHTAFSPNIKERRDCSAAVFNAQGLMVSQAEHIPVHLGAMPESLKAALEIFPESHWNDGDIVILNDPFEGGTHLPDITLISPVVIKNQIIGFVANRAHHADVGGKAPGSMPGDSTEIYQEGLRIPPIKLVEKHKPNQSLWRLLLANVRTPNERQGDLQAQIAANMTGISRYTTTVKKYGLHVTETFLNDLLDYSEHRMRNQIGKIPKGVFEFTDYMDDDGVTENPVKIHVKVTIHSKHIVFDFTGTEFQTAGNINAPFAVTLSTSYYVLRCITDPSIPANAGCYRPLSVIAPKGCFLNPRLPAAVSAGNVETSQRIVDVLFGALSQALSNRIPAASQGTMNNLIIGGQVPKSQQAFTFYETIGGGLGARPTKDGVDGIHSHMTNTANTPIEALETSYPLRVKCYHLSPNSAGRGKYRGGLGIRRDIEILTETAVVSIQSERRKHTPWGLQGGDAGRKGKNRLYHNNQWLDLPGKVTLRVQQGDIVSIQTPGGGGFGKPATRRQSLKEQDRKSGKIRR